MHFLSTCFWFYHRICISHARHHFSSASSACGCTGGSPPVVPRVYVTQCWVTGPTCAMPEPTEAEAEADPEDGDVHEADMEEPADAEPTAAEYQSFFDSILALP